MRRPQPTPSEDVRQSICDAQGCRNAAAATNWGLVASLQKVIYDHLTIIIARISQNRPKYLEIDRELGYAHAQLQAPTDANGGWDSLRVMP